MKSNQVAPELAPNLIPIKINPSYKYSTVDDISSSHLRQLNCNISERWELDANTSFNTMEFDDPFRHEPLDLSPLRTWKEDKGLDGATESQTDGPSFIRYWDKMNHLAMKEQTKGDLSDWLGPDYLRHKRLNNTKGEVVNATTKPDDQYCYPPTGPCSDEFEITKERFSQCSVDSRLDNSYSSFIFHQEPNYSNTADFTFDRSICASNFSDSNSTEITTDNSSTTVHNNSSLGFSSWGKLRGDSLETEIRNCSVVPGEPVSETDTRGQISHLINFCTSANNEMVLATTGSNFLASQFFPVEGGPVRSASTPMQPIMARGYEYVDVEDDISQLGSSNDLTLNSHDSYFQIGSQSNMLDSISYISKPLFAKFRQGYGTSESSSINYSYYGKAPPNTPTDDRKVANELNYYQKKFNIDLWLELLKDILPNGCKVFKDSEDILKCTALYIHFIKGKIGSNFDEEFLIGIKDML